MISLPEKKRTRIADRHGHCEPHVAYTVHPPIRKDTIPLREGNATSLPRHYTARKGLANSDEI